MACISSPAPKWHNSRPQHRVPAPHRPVHPYGVAPNHGRYMTPSMVSRGRSPLFDRGQAAHVESSNLAESFAPLKSPMSKCIDTIIGAAEAVNRRDAWLHAHYGPPSKKKYKRTIAEPASPKQAQMEISSKLESALADKQMNRALILTMALERPRKEKDDLSPLPPPEIREGFYWKEYPALETVLFDQMAEYYSFSSNQRQSKHQQAYNNKLVEKVRTKADELGYSFNPIFFTDKRLRDRIRCFYKTHLQNAKKRLHTMKKHLDSPEQCRALNELIVKAQDCPEAQFRSLA